MKKFLFTTSVALFAFFSFLAPTISFAETVSVSTPLTMFTRDGCTHCADEKAFLVELQKTRTDIEVIYRDLAEEGSRADFDALTALEKLPKATPLTLVGNTLLQGFDTAETTGKRIVELLDASRGKPTLSVAEYLAAGGSLGGVETVAGKACDEEGCALPGSELIVRIPFFGVVDLRPYSLPTMSIVLGFIDGFNPCAMWVLVTFLLVLMQIGDRRKMWIVAGLFIFAETIMYYLILNVWFTTWNFIGLDQIVTPIVGIVAIGGGLFFLYEWKTSDGTCKVTNLSQRQKTHARIKDIVTRPFTLLTALAVIGLALSVNIIEFACSIGIPQAFTKILDLNEMTWLAKQGLMALYILFYMIDDFIVFGLALWSFEHLHLTQKYSKWCNLIGGILMVILGALLIFDPNWLRFF